VSRGQRLLLVEVIVPCALVVIWYVTSLNSTSFYFPPLKTILGNFWSFWLGKGFMAQVVPSIGRMIIGYGLAIVGGVIVGVCVGLSTWAHNLANPLVEFLRSIPSILLIPFGIVVLGVGTSMKVFIIALGCAFPIILNTADGIRSVEPTLIDVARTFKLSGWTRLFRVVLPSASPQIFAGLRASLPLALILMVVSEMLASTNGIGYSILQAQTRFVISEMWSGIIVLGILGYLVNLILTVAEGRVLAWHRGYRASLLGKGPTAPRVRRNTKARTGRPTIRVEKERRG
jgi:ABC-type nitrate/sulfonate/bicarbonate transport system permease component